MSFFYKFRTLGNGNSYEWNAQLEISVHEVVVTGEVEADATEGNGEKSVKLFPESVDEKKYGKCWNFTRPNLCPYWNVGLLDPE